MDAVCLSEVSKMPVNLNRFLNVKWREITNFAAEKLMFFIRKVLC